MKYLEFWNKDKMPILGLGTWKSSKGEVYDAVCEAIKMGYKHIDCAAIYGNEPEIGQALNDCISDGIVKREDLWITSKLWNSNHGRENVVIGLNKTLADLQLKYIDLYLIHWPVALKSGVGFPTSVDQFLPPEAKPIEDTWKGMEDILEMGLAKHIGLSNFNVQKIESLLPDCNYQPEVIQVEMHPLLQQKELFEFCSWNNIKMTAYAPLGARDLEKIKAGDEPDLLDQPVILDISERYKITPAQVLLAWSITRNISVIPKSVNKERMLQNLKAAEMVIAPEDMAKIATMERNFRFISGGLWTVPGSPYTSEDLWGNPV
jgi:alcohol dehydrogenase (NADP+)